MKPDFQLFTITAKYENYSHSYIEVLDANEDFEDTLWKKHAEIDLVVDIEYKPFVVEGYSITVSKDE